MPVAEKIRNWVFDQVHVNNLVYNTCWEDPRCDRALLNFDDQSEIVMITSAGCNALDYLLDDVKKVHCMDVNPRQNALLQLKLSLFNNTDHETLFQFFGKGKHPDHEAIYWQKLRSDIIPYGLSFWDKHIKYFSEKGVRKNFYHYGTAGTFVWLLGKYLRSRKKLFNEVMNLFDAKSLEEQRKIYHKIEPKVLNKLVELIVNQHFTMCLLGVPRSQQELFINEHKNGAMGFIQKCLYHVFTELPIHENYFYRVYVHGEYTKECCPEYLKEANFEFLKDRTTRVQTYTNTLSQFLINHPGSYSHFVLLDHQDWLADNNIEALEEEWDLILKNSRPGTKFILRSAAAEVDFFPDFVKERCTFDYVNTDTQHQLDRVGTYASVYVGEVK